MLLDKCEYAWICGNIREYCYICLSVFCFTFLHCNSLSEETTDCFLEEKKFDFFIVAESILFAFRFRRNIFTIKISNLLLPLVGPNTAQKWQR